MQMLAKQWDAAQNSLPYGLRQGKGKYTFNKFSTHAKGTTKSIAKNKDNAYIKKTVFKNGQQQRVQLL